MQGNRGQDEDLQMRKAHYRCDEPRGREFEKERKKWSERPLLIPFSIS